MTEAEFDPLAGPATIPAQLAASAERFGSTCFLAGEDGRRLTFDETKALAERAARGFMASGLERGDRVALWAPNSIEWVIACLGLQIAGGILVPLNTRFKGEEAAALIERCGARFLCTVGDFLANDYPAMLRASRPGGGGDRPVAGLPRLERLIMLDGSAWTDFLGTAEAIDPTRLDQRIAAIRPDDIADILFTSGTTGEPKGAMHSHAQALGAVRSFNFVNGTVPGDRMVIVNPFFHSFGYRAGWVASLLDGMTAYPVAMLDPGALMTLIERERISVLPGPPALFQTILDSWIVADLGSLRLGITGAANISIDLIQRCYEELGLEVLLTSYGLTEATAMGTSCRPGDSYRTIATTVGRPFPGWSVRTVDSRGAPAATGEPGEIQFRGFNVMKGYFEDPEATRDAMTADGWLRTGDVGILDEVGYLRVVDRLKDVVIVGGFNVYPAEVERMLREAPGVTDVAVVGMADPRLGEVCAAFVVASGTSFDEDALINWSRARMANFKVPRRFFAIDALPRTPLGKVQKFLLKQRAAAACAASA